MSQIAYLENPSFAENETVKSPRESPAGPQMLNSRPANPNGCRNATGAVIIITQQQYNPAPYPLTFCSSLYNNPGCHLRINQIRGINCCPSALLDDNGVCAPNGERKTLMLLIACSKYKQEGTKRFAIF